MEKMIYQEIVDLSILLLLVIEFFVGKLSGESLFSEWSLYFSLLYFVTSFSINETDLCHQRHWYATIDCRSHISKCQSEIISCFWNVIILSLTLHFSIQSNLGIEITILNRLDAFTDFQVDFAWNFPFILWNSICSRKGVWNIPICCMSWHRSYRYSALRAIFHSLVSKLNYATIFWNIC